MHQLLRSQTALLHHSPADFVSDHWHQIALEIRDVPKMIYHDCFLLVQLVLQTCATQQNVGLEMILIRRLYVEKWRAGDDTLAAAAAAARFLPA